MTGLIGLPMGVVFTAAGWNIAGHGWNRMRQGGLWNFAVGGTMALSGLGTTVGGVGLTLGSLYDIGNSAFMASRAFVNSRPRTGL